MQEEIERRAARIAEINREIARLLPDFLRAGGDMAAARVDAALWADRLDPLFDEHHRLSVEIKDILRNGQ